MSPSKPVSEESHLADTLAVLRKRWRTLAATFVGFVAVAALVSFRLPPVYEAEARIVIGSGHSRSLMSDGFLALESYFLERRSFETQLEVIQSEPVALLAAQRLGWIDAETPDAERLQRAAAVKGALEVQHLRDTRIVQLRAHDSAPERARAIANAVAEAYILFAEEQGTEARNRSVAWLTQEIDALRDKLRLSEEKLVEYLSQADVEAPVGESPGEMPPADETLRTQLATAELQLTQLLGRYRNLHPEVQEARKRVAGLRARIADAQASRAEDSRRLIQYRLLKRDAQLDREMYDVLLKKLKEADINDQVTDADIRILEAAKLPGAPIAPRTGRNLGVAAVLGLCLALMLAYLVEYFDRSLGSAEEVTRSLGLATLGVVGSFGRRRSDALAVEAGGSLGEAFRTLRTNLRFSHVDVPRRVVLVTSTGPEEGKSTVVSNLGASLAQSGRRTLVIDTDLRRPSLHRALGAPRSRGLADILAGDASPEDAIRGTRIGGLDVLPCGTVPANPAELIESARLQELLAALRGRYEYVILDSPPAGGLVDASLLSSLADGVLFVIEPGRFDWRAIRGALRQLERAGARVYGAVLNKADTDGAASLYGYYAESVPAKAAAGAA
jgi:capsular exopolysaccharide synthesis family protein